MEQSEPHRRAVRPPPPPPLLLLLLLILVDVGAEISYSAEGGALDDVGQQSELRLAAAARGAVVAQNCNGSIAECGAAAELLMDSEIHRRFLGQSRPTITYPVVRTADKQICPESPSGHPYNCIPRPSNPYDRGCLPIYGCRR
ncbi:hypothetical protein Cni_G21592 [Canna indica]|uniref:Uncharacterized protein n=1 Tax=Canna indica TaxID=4628 RepID=A0AAQ3QIU6_9LILI|nr:hypothetical protein Cni_G21592 [Canna indica]